MPVIEDADALPARRGTVYPLQFAEGLQGRVKRALTEALGLTQFGVNLTTLEPGAKSSQRHCHTEEDEFIYVLAGEIVLVTGEGERVLKPGMSAGFPRGDGNAHQLVNRGTIAATLFASQRRALSVTPSAVANGLRWLAAGVLKLPIHVYRYTLKAFVGYRCRHMPTCSEYALEAIDRNGPWRGFWLTISRMSRCRPWGTSGYDPVPDINAEHHALAPWRYGRWRARPSGPR